MICRALLHMLNVCGFMLAPAIAGETVATTDQVFELRNYTLHPGQRDTLIDLFERQFIESQEALGAHIVATFRDLDAPDHFVWLRSFADMAARPVALNAFYTGPIWKAHAKAANATMIDSDNVHLLHPVGEPMALPKERPPLGAADPAGSMFVVDIYPLNDKSEAELYAIVAGDSRIVAAFATEQSPNNFPALPVREDIVFVMLRRFPAHRAAAAHRRSAQAETHAAPGADPSLSAAVNPRSRRS